MSKKITVGIFGDSFGFAITPWPFQNNNSVGLGWPELLANHPDYEVTNFCEGGSSFWHSYQQFLKKYKSFDKVIFLATFPGRLTINVPGFSELATSFKHHPTIDCVQRWKKIAVKRIKNTSTINLALTYLDAIENYFLYVKNDSYDEYIQWLFIDHLKELKKDIIIIPCFYNSVKNLDTTPLTEIGYKELKHFFGNIPLTRIYQDLINEGRSDHRKCHMSEENNYTLYTLMLKFLQNEPINIDLSLFVTPTYSLNHYWIKDHV